MQSPRSILVGWLVVRTLLYQASLSKSKISLQIKYTSFGPITKCSIHEMCITIYTFTSLSPIYDIYNICCITLDLAEDNCKGIRPGMASYKGIFVDTVANVDVNSVE